MYFDHGRCMPTSLCGVVSMNVHLLCLFSVFNEL